MGASPVPRPLIHMRDVGFEVHGGAPARILHPFDLTVRAGASLAVVGPSGAGKSTLASILGTLLRPSEGSYELDGTDITRWTSRRLAYLRRDTVGFVFQHAHLIDERSTLQNVGLGLPPSDPRSRKIREAVSRQTLAAVGLGAMADRGANTLSGGERQRAAIARALVKQPRLLIADEPTGSLDQATGKQILDLLYGARSDQTALVVVTHDVRAADRADRVITVVDGHVS